MAISAKKRDGFLFFGNIIYIYISSCMCTAAAALQTPGPGQRQFNPWKPDRYRIDANEINYLNNSLSHHHVKTSAA